MTKSLALAILVLCISHMFYSTNAQAARTCQIGYWGPTPPPTCTPEGCQAVGSPIAAAQLDSSNRSLSISSFQLEGMSFNGSCACRVRFYSGPNLRGTSARFSFSRRNNFSVTSSRIWSRPTNSFTVTCQF